MTQPLLRAETDGVRIHVKLTPRAAKNVIDGPAVDAHGSAVLKARVTAVPEKGKANAALIKILAKETRLPKSAFEIVSGETDRNKTLLVRGDPDALMAQLKIWIEGLA